MSPKDLAQVLRQLPKFEDANMLISGDTLDDAGVYRLSDEVALVQTVDIFTPVVDDPYDYGAIVAANSLSDVYAMGGKPLTVLNIIGFPPKKMDHNIIAGILKGGADKVKESGAVIVGGHSIIDPELKYGMAVTGLIHPKRIVTNAGARPGDVMILTKPLGIGIITMANTMDKVSDDLMKRIVKSMATLNKTASEVMMEVGVDACTDITGFGLMGHAYNVGLMSKVSLRFSAAKIPVFEEAREFARESIMPGGSFSNKDYYGQFTKVENGVSEEIQNIAFDAQTSGGLLMSVPKDNAEQMLKELHKQGVSDAVIVGEVIPKQDKQIILGK